jgi:phosphomethylpyrimidine synthase
VREFAAKQNAKTPDEALSADEAEAGMDEMSRRFEESGGELYVPAED